ncbi:MAG: hypothetical protein NTZ24_03995 [Deltaproteobacteria bacterium]|nr:hypothetical protein [Deltaproteobacteria bacterium]
MNVKSIYRQMSLYRFGVYLKDCNRYDIPYWVMAPMSVFQRNRQYLQGKPALIEQMLEEVSGRGAHILRVFVGLAA